MRGFPSDPMPFPPSWYVTPDFPDAPDEDDMPDDPVGHDPAQVPQPDRRTA